MWLAWVAIAFALMGPPSPSTGASESGPTSVRTAEPDSRVYTGRLDPIGPFRLRDLDGRVRTAEEFKGRVLIVYEWASWCGPCVKGFPMVQALHERVRSDPGVAMVTFDMDEDLPSIQGFLSDLRKKYSFPVLPAAARFRFLALPHTWIVDRDGFLREGIDGEGPGFVEDVLALVDAVKRRLPVSQLPEEAVRTQREANARDAARSR